MRRTKASLIYRRTKTLRVVQLLLDHTKLESTVRYLGIEIDDALETAEQTEVEMDHRSASANAGANRPGAAVHTKGKVCCGGTPMAMFGVGKRICRDKLLTYPDLTDTTG